MTKGTEILEFMKEMEEILEVARQTAGTNVNFDAHAFFLWKLNKKEDNKIEEDGTR